MNFYSRKKRILDEAGFMAQIKYKIQVNTLLMLLNS
jgi:hypothetical protein